MNARVMAAVSIGAVLIASCAGGPKPLDWQIEAKGAMERALAAYLEGNGRVEQAAMAIVRSRLARTGRADLLANAELAACAARVASLVFEPCVRFEPLRRDVPEAQRAYADYLLGRPAPQDLALLPEPQRAAAHAGSIAQVADPLSRLVAAGVLLRAGKASPEVIGQAIDTASSQGWRRPLAAWLGVQARRAELAGRTEEAAALRRRIALTQ
ncbi:MAG: hypothetical protein Fur0039_19670 [Rhodocyclaceae bacterium]